MVLTEKEVLEKQLELINSQEKGVTIQYELQINSFAKKKEELRLVIEQVEE